MDLEKVIEAAPKILQDNNIIPSSTILESVTKALVNIQQMGIDEWEKQSTYSSMFRRVIKDIAKKVS